MEPDNMEPESESTVKKKGYYGRTPFSMKTGVYINILIAENLDLQDGDYVEFWLVNDEIVIRKELLNPRHIMRSPNGR